MKDIVKVRPLRPHEKIKLRRLKRQRRNAVNSHNARMILLAVGGRPNRVIAEMVGCSMQWVRQIVHRFNDDGIDGIIWYPWFQVRAARVFTADICEHIAEIALSSPIALIGMTQWSVPKLRQYLVEQKVVAHISIRWLGEILRRYQVRLRRTKTWKESTDPLFARKYRAIRHLYRHRPANGRRLCIDEFGPLNLQPHHGHCRQGPGKRVERLRATYDRHQGVRHFLAYYDLETDRLYGRFTTHKKAKDFLSFLRWVRSRYPHSQTLHVVILGFTLLSLPLLLTWGQNPSTPPASAACGVNDQPGAESDAPTPLGKLYEVGGHKMHLYQTGNGSSRPAVVLEAGAGAFSLDWYSVQQGVASFATVCSYDRAGHAWSELGPHPRTMKQAAYDLRRLLAKAGVPGPYVMVGHSLGVSFVRVFATEYPNDVVGLVLVDPGSGPSFINGKLVGPWENVQPRQIPAPRDQIRDDERVLSKPELESYKKFREWLGPPKIEKPFDKLPEPIQKLRLWAMSLPQSNVTDYNPYGDEESFMLFADPFG